MPESYIYRANVPKPKKGQRVYYRGGRYILGSAASPPPLQKKATTTTPGTAAPAAKPLTLAQTQLNEAKAIAAAAIDPEVAEIMASIKSAQTARTSAADQARLTMQALGQLTAGDAEANRLAYDAAAKRVGEYGNLFSGQLRSDIDAAVADTNARLQAIGAQGGPVSAPTDAIVNAANYSGVLVPGQTLATKAGIARQSTSDARAAALAGLAEAWRQTDYKAGLDIAKIRDTIGAVEAKRPGLIMGALTDIRQAYQQKRATDVQIGTLQLQQAKTLFDQAVAQTNLTGTLWIVVGKGKNARLYNTRRPAPGSDSAVAAVQAATSRANNAATNAQRERDRQTREQNAMLGRQTATENSKRLEAGRNARAKAARDLQLQIEREKQTNPSRGITANERASLVEGAQAAGVQALSAYVTKVWSNVPGNQLQQKDETREEYEARIQKAAKILKNRLRMNYGTAMARIVNTIGEQLKLAGWTREQIFALARKIVAMEIPAPPKPPKGENTSARGGR